jgi:hypothetical protein
MSAVHYWDSAIYRPQRKTEFPQENEAEDHVGWHALYHTMRVVRRDKLELGHKELPTQSYVEDTESRAQLDIARFADTVTYSTVHIENHVTVINASRLFLDQPGGEATNPEIEKREVSCDEQHELYQVMSQEGMP